MEKQDGYWLGAHACFLLEYHLVLVTKYRAKALIGEPAESMKQDIEELMKDKGCVINEISVQPDHVHILFEAPPWIQISGLVNVVKSTTARRAKKKFPEHYKRFFWKPVFWTDSYFVATVSGRSNAAVSAYIRNQ